MFVANTVNFTGSIDPDLLRRAKIVAAKLDTSVNALFRAEMGYLVDTFEAAEARGNRNYAVLVEFAIGGVDSAEAMETLGIDAEEDLFLLMAQARLPMPRLSDDRTEAMIEELLRRHGDEGDALRRA